MGILARGEERDEDNIEFERAVFASLLGKGWIEGRNLSVIRAYSGESEARLPALAKELVRRRVDVILTGGFITTVAAARATSKIPIVFSDPVPYAVEQELIESFARPGRNVTGASLDHSAGMGKAGEYLRQLVPSARRIAAIATHQFAKTERVSGGLVDTIAPAQAAWRSQGFEQQTFFYRGFDDIARAFAEVDRWRADAITVGVMEFADARQIIELASRRRLPSVFAYRKYVEAGGLMSFGPMSISTAEQGKNAASYIDRILRGADPATLPVEMPTRWELVINAKTAGAFGLSIPRALQVTAEILR
jgi:putative ABC transport system substrate-binding protein